MAKPVLSIGIIFRDDIRSIERCLTALEPLRAAIPCQLVMADTGSADGSRAVAERFADILFDFPWIDDFAAARNAVMDRCTGQWFLAVDTDEYLDEDVSELVYFLTHKKKQQHDFCSVIQRNYDTFEMDHDYSNFMAVRMARMSTGVRYEGAIHEHWPAPKSGKMTLKPLKQTILHHDGYVGMNTDKGKAKRERNVTLIRKKLEEDPEHLMTRLQMIESGSLEDDFLEQLRRSVELVQQGVNSADMVGPPIMRYAVIFGQARDLPEMEEWLQWMDEHFPNSLYTRLDAAYYAMMYYLKRKDYPRAISYGEKYLAGQRDYKAGQTDRSAELYSVLKTASPYWEQDLKILLASAYCKVKKFEQTMELLRTLEHYTKYDGKQISNLLITLKDVHRYSTLDTASLITAFWRGVSRPEPNQARADMRIKAFFKTGVRMFLPDTRRLDEIRADIFRPSFTLFTPLDGECELGSAAVIWEETDPQALTQKLPEVNWERTPIHILGYALERGAVFPHPEKPMNVEEMDLLAGRLVRSGEQIISWLAGADSLVVDSLQSLCWARSLVLAAVQTFKWADEGANVETGLALARTFVQVEQEFLALCYAPDVLVENHLFLLPPFHRFGWYCVRAFEALDSGDAIGYVRLLRSGLSVCSNAKDMAEFLLEHTPELQTKPEPSAELLALADQIRSVLANFAPDDPAVAALKQSEAYQKVAYLIEGSSAPVVGGLLQ